MIKLVHLITDLSIGGAEMMLYKLLGGMDRSRFHNVVVSMTGPGVLEERIRALGVPVLSLGMRPGAPDPPGFFRLIRFLGKDRPQILQTWLYHADLLGLLAGKCARVPAVVWNVRCSDVDLGKYSKLTAGVIRVLAALSPYPDVLVVNSEAGRRLHETLGYHPRRWDLIPNGFDLEVFHPDAAARPRFRAELGLASDALLIGLIARFDPMKDHDNFLQAAQCLLRRRAGVHFILAGRSVEPANTALAAAVRARGLEANVHLLGERRDMAYIMAALDILSSSSYGEGFPNVLGEAMASGVPCVATDVGDCARVVGDTGRVVPPKDPSALAEAWHELIEAGPMVRGRLGLSARDRIAAYFSLPVITTRYEALYERLAKADSVRPAVL